MYQWTINYTGNANSVTFYGHHALCKVSLGELVSQFVP